MLRAALTAVAKDRKQPKCRSTVQWVNKLWPVHTTESLSAEKKKQRMDPTAQRVFHRVKEARHKTAVTPSVQSSRRGQTNGY